MSDYRFARRPAWIAGHVLAACLLVLFIVLGLWQLRRLDERRVDNALIEERAVVARVPVDELVAAADDDDPDDLRFRAVDAAGSYREGADVAVRATQDGRSGARVFSLLDLPNGESVVVLRGFVPVQEDGSIEVPPPPAGEVEVEGLAIPIERLESVFRRGVDDLPVDEGSLPVVIQAAAADNPDIAVVGPPDLGEGPHFGYAVQWFLFAAVGLVGYPLLLRRRAGEADHGA
jgi:surfeit locus 1 family protein